MGHSSSSEVLEKKQCWICLDGQSAACPLINGVCLCRGSVGSVHQECIDNWVLYRSNAVCGSCGVPYRVVWDALPEGVRIPSTFLEKSDLVIGKLVVPLLKKTALMIIGVFMRLILVPAMLGLAFHWQHLAGITLPLPESAVVHPSAESISHVNGGLLPSSRIFACSWWLWLNVMLYGWLSLAAIRALRKSWQSWWAFSFPNGSDEADSASELPPAHGTPVETLFSVVEEAMHHFVSGKGIPTSVGEELLVGLGVASILSVREGVYFAVATVLYASVMCRWFFPRKVIASRRRRYDEVGERLRETSVLDAYRWFCTYLMIVLCLSILLPLAAGVVVHYTISPYFATFPSSLEAFVTSLTIVRCVVYWLIGGVCSLLLMSMESNIMMAIFAPGVDLFFIRSVEVPLDSHDIYWRYLLTHIFDMDPLSAVLDSLQVAGVELAALYVFASVPVWLLFFLRDRFAEDVPQNISTQWVPVGLPLATPEAISGGLRSLEWLNLKQQEFLSAATQSKLHGLYAGQVFELGGLLLLKHFTWLSNLWKLPKALRDGCTAGGFHLDHCMHFALSSHGDTAPRDNFEMVTASLLEGESDGVESMPNYLGIFRSRREGIVKSLDSSTRPDRMVSPGDISGLLSVSALIFYSWDIPIFSQFKRTEAEWILRHPSCVTLLVNYMILCNVFVLLLCFRSNLIHRLQLRVLRTLTHFVGERAMHMGEYLFDAERTASVDYFLSHPEISVLNLPQVPAEQLFCKREDMILPTKTPHHLRLRLLLFSIVFLTASTVMFWAIPIAVMVLLMSVMRSSVLLVTAAFSTCLVFYSPSMFFKNTIMVAVGFVFVIAAIIYDITSRGAFFFLSLWTSLVQDTLAYHYRLRRKVGLYEQEEEVRPPKSEAGAGRVTERVL